MQINYSSAGVTITRFHQSTAFVRGLRGPVGSGKSVACAMECFILMSLQEPNEKGIRQTRGAIIRNTGPQLKTTTIKTWQAWFPEETFGRINWDPPFTQQFRCPLPDGTTIECEVMFLALDTIKDLRRLLSLELTWAWVNEAREVAKENVDMVINRLDRFPSPAFGPGPTRPSLIMDTNATAPDHWWAIMSGDMPVPDYMSAEDAVSLVKPEGWEFFAQPAAVMPILNERDKIVGYKINPERENRTLQDRYYLNQIPGKTTDWIAVYLRNRYGNVKQGNPVFPSFSRQTHVATEPLEMIPGVPIFCGMDFGLTPAAVFGQKHGGVVRILRELFIPNCGILRFAGYLKDFIAQEFPTTGLDEHRFIFIGDPAGDQRAQTDERTPFDILSASEISAVPGSTNDPVLRCEAVNHVLARMVDGQPGYVADPRCVRLIAGLDGGYVFDRFGLPRKDEHSHVQDAHQYLLDGMGETRDLLRRRGGANMTRPRQANTTFKVFGKRAAARQSALRLPKVF